MKHLFISICLFAIQSVVLNANNNPLLYPENNASNINPDTHLKITFGQTPQIGEKGMIRIYDAKNNKLVDCLDMSIPAGPKVPDTIRKKEANYTSVPYKYETTNFTNANTIAGTPSGTALRDTSNYQLTIIGRFTDGFRFHPIIIRDKTATIYPHNNLLEYDKEYYVTIDKGVLNTPDNNFKGIESNSTWRFKTKAKTPNSRKLIISADGNGDFNTVQGCMDFIPDFSSEKWEVFIKNGDYEELVYFRNKCNITITGESREGVIIHYANNETFNPHPINVKTNEWPGTFPSRRAAFAADNCYDLRFENLTIKTTLTGQAEGLLIMGERNYLKNVHISGSGDALQVNGSIYLEDCRIDGHGDTVLGRGPAFFSNCTISSYGPFMWIRNTEKNHGNIFLNCTFMGLGDGAVIARSSVNKGTGYPHAEAVLINCKLNNVQPVGWGTISGDTHNLRFWEYNSQSLDGKSIDTSQRHPLSRQLSKDKDMDLIKEYSNPEFILKWNPNLSCSDKQ